MTTLIHCKGHEFEELQDDGKPVWYCLHCDLKVKRKGAAEYLKGKTC